MRGQYLEEVSVVGLAGLVDRVDAAMEEAARPSIGDEWPKRALGLAGLRVPVQAVVLPAR